MWLKCDQSVGSENNHDNNQYIKFQNSQYDENITCWTQQEKHVK